MSPKTVLMLLSNAYDPDPRVRQEALSLRAMGCDVQIIAWDRDLKAAARDTVEGIRVERVFVASTHGRGVTQIVFYLWLYLKMLWRGLRTRSALVHCHDLDTLPVGFLLGKLRSKPVVYDAHESFPDMLEGSVPPAVQRLLVRLEDFLIRRVDVVITVGEKLRQHFIDRGAKRVVVVGNWKRLVEFSRTPKQIAEIRRSLGVPDGALLIVCITQLLKDRKIDELLDAAAACPDVYVLMAGSGVMAERIAQTAESNPRVLFKGFVSGGTIGDYTCAADAIYYGFDPQNPNARFSAPNKLYEALAAGRPLITGDFGEIAEVVHESDCGVVLNAYSRIEIVRAIATLRDPDTRARMAANAGRTGRLAMNWDKAQDVLYREYSSLLPGLRVPTAEEYLEPAQVGVGGR